MKDQPASGEKPATKPANPALHSSSTGLRGGSAARWARARATKKSSHQLPDHRKAAPKHLAQADGHVVAVNDKAACGLGRVDHRRPVAVDQQRSRRQRLGRVPAQVNLSTASVGKSASQARGSRRWSVQDTKTLLMSSSSPQPPAGADAPIRRVRPGDITPLSAAMDALSMQVRLQSK